ncbi:MAG: DUF4388 domain-containing protein, partial [candidate division Zixibacteria bacterium]|nr:DUF4388 domain-containing protein [candidate division Zixibacteria bacterium]
EGSLNRFSVAEVFQLLSFSRKTGTLGLQRNEEVAMVYFKQGNVIYAYTPQQKIPLGELLVGQGVLTEKQLTAALAEKDKNPSRKIGEILVKSGFVSRSQMEEAVRRQVEELIYRLLHWEVGNFKFYENEFPTEEEVLIHISTENLILEGVRRLDELEEVKQRLPEFGTVLIVKPIPSQRTRDVALKGDEWNILSLIDGRKDIFQIIERSNTDRLTTLKNLAALFMSGLIEPVKDGADGGDDKLAGLVEKLSVLLETYEKK